MQHKRSQTDVILGHLEDIAPITSLEAFEKYRITRLSARIHDLREQGENIQTEIVKGKDGTRYAKYWLVTGTKLECPYCGNIFDVGQGYDRGVTADCPFCGYPVSLNDEHREVPDWRDEMRESWLMERIANYR